MLQRGKSGLWTTHITCRTKPGRTVSYWPSASRQRPPSAALAVDTPYGQMDSPTSSAREKCHQLVIAWHTPTIHRFRNAAGLFQNRHREGGRCDRVDRE